MSQRTFEYLVIHHSAGSPNTTLEDIDRMHRKERDPPFLMVGYHHVIEGSGEIRAGRPMDWIGAHAPPHNSDSIGVCVVGDNTNLEDRWTQAQWRSLYHYVKACLVLWPYLKVRGHRDIGSTATECPGLDIGDWWTQVKEW